MKKIRNNFKKLRKEHPVTYYILLINNIIFLVSYAITIIEDPLYGLGFILLPLVDPHIYIFVGAMDLNMAREGHIYQLLTSMFVHFGGVHFFMNMFVLSAFGKLVEEGLGRKKYLALYLSSGLVGNILTLLFTEGKMSAGASGSIFGLLAFMFVVSLLRKEWFTKKFRRSLTFDILINTVVTFSIPFINKWAHAGGFVAGAVFTLIFIGSVRCFTNYEEEKRYKDMLKEFEAIKHQIQQEIELSKAEG